MARRQTGGDPRIALIDKVEVIPFRFWSRSGFSLRGGIEWGAVFGAPAAPIVWQEVQKRS